MTHDIHHEHLIKEITEMFAPVLQNSPQGIYIYLDDAHKVCNKKFADMLGYSSPEEWAQNEYPVSDVSQTDQEKVIQGYMNASRKFIGTTIQAKVKTKSGKLIQTSVTMAPISYKNEVFVLHFISPQK